jgi:nucleoside phosphorylase
LNQLGSGPRDECTGTCEAADVTTAQVLEQLLREVPRRSSEHRAWSAKVAAFLREIYGDEVASKFSNMNHERLAVLVEMQRGMLIGVLNKVRDGGAPYTSPVDHSLPIEDQSFPQRTSPERGKVDLAILTALPLELEAVLRHGGTWARIPLGEPGPRTFYHHRTERGAVAIAGCALGMGQLNAALVARDTIDAWHPKRMILTGIAGGIGGNVRLGDIVVSEQIVDYELGRVDGTDTPPRWSVYRSDPALLDPLRNFREDGWAASITVPRPDGRADIMPRVIFGVVLSGNKVIADATATGAMRSVWSRAVAIEMEGAGIAAAVHQMKGAPPFLVAKSICDMADSRKNDAWQSYAADVAAAFTVSLLAAWDAAD